MAGHVQVDRKVFGGGRSFAVLVFHKIRAALGTSLSANGVMSFPYGMWPELTKVCKY